MRERNEMFSTFRDAVEEHSNTSTVTEADYLESCEDGIREGNSLNEPYDNIDELAMQTRREQTNHTKSTLAATNETNLTCSTRKTTAATSELLPKEQIQDAREGHATNVETIMQKMYTKMEESKPSLYISLLEPHTKSTLLGTNAQQQHQCQQERRRQELSQHAEKVRVGCCGLQRKERAKKEKKSKDINELIDENETIDNAYRNSNSEEIVTRSVANNKKETENLQDNMIKEKWENKHERTINANEQTSLVAQKEEQAKSNKNVFHINANDLTHNNSKSKPFMPTVMSSLLSPSSSSSSSSECVKTNRQVKNRKSNKHVTNNSIEYTKKYYQICEMQEMHPLVLDEPEEHNNKQEYWVQSEPSSNFRLLQTINEKEYLQEIYDTFCHSLAELLQPQVTTQIQKV